MLQTFAFIMKMCECIHNNLRAVNMDYYYVYNFGNSK